MTSVDVQDYRFLDRQIEEAEVFLAICRQQPRLDTPETEPRPT